MLFSQRDIRRLEVAPTFWGTQKTSLYCLHERGNREGRHRKWRASPYNFTEGGKWEWRETEIRTVVKVLLNVFAFPSEEEMKAYVNKPLHPILSIPVPSFRQRQAVLKHQWCSIETDLVI